MKSLFAATLASVAMADHYALLVAGTKGYENYRHQSDVAAMGQTLRMYGFPSDNVITLAYDDIAYNEKNPFQGLIFNDDKTRNHYFKGE